MVHLRQARIFPSPDRQQVGGLPKPALNERVTITINEQALISLTTAPHGIGAKGRFGGPVVGAADVGRCTDRDARSSPQGFFYAPVSFFSRRAHTHASSETFTILPLALCSELSKRYTVSLWRPSLQKNIKLHRAGGWTASPTITHLESLFLQSCLERRIRRLTTSIAAWKPRPAAPKSCLRLRITLIRV